MTDYYVCDSSALPHLPNKRYLNVYYYHNKYHGTQLFHAIRPRGYVLVEDLSDDELVLLTLVCNSITKVSLDMFSHYLVHIINGISVFTWTE